ncbi:glycoside hydrolase family 3 C-terminal domain-containing protein [Vibrio aestuarianus]|uniref:glycoside hydrolase family 3 protein n=1 Tax=Vibrio aestuarianus TaxID=28171 RepID=UPI00237D0B7C|nr:glycoside hydrolase family 3 protein [Vibrio aestuarianus]MDE1248491.1 glycoside hydrolase family 3 C-terminal domain-containing protein [Vibrio aestuarianus]
MNKDLITQVQSELAPVSRQAAAEGIVLLKNEKSVLPLKTTDTVSLFGRCQIDTYRSGTGSGGAVNVPYAVSALEGLKANPMITLNQELVAKYQEWLVHNPFDDGGGGWAAEPWFQKEMPVTEALVKEAANRSNKALVFIGRTAGEDQDNADEVGSYQLTELEMDMLNKVTEGFDDVIVIMNTTNIMDMSWLTTLEHKDSISAVLYSWAAGMEGGHALADVLSGRQSPSGRLTDTIAYRLEDYPSYQYFGRKDYNLYVEDIYVGYRYFETFKPEAVQFPFGAGLSYTQFKRELEKFEVVGSGTQAKLVFDVRVTNIGDTHKAKEVVQLYVAAPQGELGKPARTLVGFEKTQYLHPMESQVVTIELTLDRLASFDDSGVTGFKNSYVIESGDYAFYLGESVREAVKIDAEWNVEQTFELEALSEAGAPIQMFDRIKPGAPTSAGVYAEVYEPVPQRMVSLEERIKSNLPENLVITGDKGIKLIDVKNGQATMQEFVAQMSPELMATIVRGEGMCSPKVTPGTAAAFGGVCDGLFDLGIPVVAAADGPSGIRMDSGHKATQVPIGTLLGCTWNKALNQELFHLVGKELKANNIDTLLGPGINIHRHPLNGRNFEYFSEDPLMTGTMAAAQTRGLKQAGVSGTIKHYAANDQETARVVVDSVMSQRALREVHIKAFEMAVKEGGASTIMTSYNPVNGHWAASNYDLNTAILRDEWGYQGIVMTDWWAKMNDPISAGEEAKTYTSFMIRSQNDIYMVVENDGAESNAMGDDTLAALEQGTLELGELQRCVSNICRFISDTPAMDRPLVAYEPIKAFASLKQAPSENSANIEQPISVNSKTNQTIELYVAKEGIYQCRGVMNYERDSLAQSACSLWINGEFSQTLPINGTDGKSVEVEGLQVRLEAGVYQLALDFVKPGVMLEQLVFTNK